MDLGELQNLAAGGPFTFNGWTLFWGFAFSTFGLWVFRRGRKWGSTKLVLLGLALLIYPYFVANPWLCFTIGAGLSFLAYRVE
jgi:hypothetical protein